MGDITTIEDLIPDPSNARRHTPRNVGMLEKSLNEVGAARSIVIDEAGTVLAGNATIEAAQQAGITRVQVVDADGETLIAVRRRGLTAEQKTKLALYDNRVAELAEWDAGVLSELAESGGGILDNLFVGRELETLLSSLPMSLDIGDIADDESSAAPVVGELPPSYVRMVQLFFTSETQLEFLRMVQTIMPRMGQTNLTDTVFEAVKYAYSQFDVPDAD